MLKRLMWLSVLKVKLVTQLSFLVYKLDNIIDHNWPLLHMMIKYTMSYM